MHRLLVVAIGLALTVLLPRPAGAEPDELALSTLPYDALSKEERVFEPLAEYLSRELGRTVYFRPVLSYDALMEGLRKRKVDIALVGAVAYLEARRAGDARAVARTVRQGRATYRGTFLVGRNSGITDLPGLRGKRLAVVDRRSTAGFYFPWLALEAAGLDPHRDLTISFAGGHEAAARQIALGAADAAVCLESVARTLRDIGSVTPIATTAEIPSDPVIVRAGLGPQLVDALRRAFLAAASDPVAARFLKGAQIDGFVATGDRDYDEVDAIVARLRPLAAGP